MLTIAWDVDDVLNNLMYEWFISEWLPKNPACGLRYEDLKTNPPHEILTVKLDRYLGSLDSFRISDHYQEMHPVNEILVWFRERGSNYRHIALTAVPVKAASFTASWVFNNFGEWIRSFHFVPSKREAEVLPEYDNDKIEYIKWLGKIDILIEDNQKCIEAAVALGVKSILIPRPWNSAKGTISNSLKLLES